MKNYYFFIINDSEISVAIKCDTLLINSDQRYTLRIKIVVVKITIQLYISSFLVSINKTL
jgi:hypothetical protein